MGNTPLAWAARNGHEEVVKLLLGRDDIDPNKPDEEGQTPLMLAALNGHEEVVRLLLGRDDIDPNQRDNYGQTSLFLAAYKGREEVVEILLGWGDIDSDKSSQCSEPSSPSVLGLGPDGPPAVVRLFSSPWTDYGK